MKTNTNFYSTLIIILLTGISIISCNTQEGPIPHEESSKIKFVENILVSVPSEFKKSTVINGTIIGVFDESQEKVINFELSSNILESLKALI